MIKEIKASADGRSVIVTLTDGTTLHAFPGDGPEPHAVVRVTSPEGKEVTWTPLCTGIVQS